MAKVLRINEAARELECSVDWLRQAEVKGKIPKARRDLNGWRVYTEEDIHRIKQLLLPASWGVRSPE